ncbi:DEAD/DEAH box helicase [Aciduricibacillus chroicocephali]|uniref:DEAD/DEAH box helicase n=1 Tax=Aciduricibacillus chroicocephali TaxID=3054939 RepID=A0ABY9KUK5_9BACI|nr:DEAD/DEAH box helicase [Bacillaceae bacterium 44XB]
MNKRVSQKEIIERCGEVSYKAGAALVQRGKVDVEPDSSADSCEVTVRTNHATFHVKLEQGPGGQIEVECDCPKLASVTTDCQHIAAALIACKARSNSTSADIRSVFSQKETSYQSARQQTRFEDRAVLDLAFTVHVQPGNLLGVRLWLGEEKVLIANIPEFLRSVQEASGYSVYNPSEHCFDSKTYRVLEQLTEMVRTELEEKQQIITIQPAYWQSIAPLLAEAPGASFKLGKGTPPIQFQFKEEAGENALVVTGMEDLIHLVPYAALLQEDTVYQLSTLQSEQLKSLRRHVRTIIPEAELKSFTKEIVPQLRLLGNVNVSPAISAKLREAKLIAKLFLDRVNGRLLASLEFHYGPIVINPLQQERQEIFQDIEMENEILQLLKESKFTETESGFYIHNEDLEYDFLYNRLPLIEKYVRVHATTAVRERVLSGPFKPRLEVHIKKERTDWLEFTFDMDAVPQSEIKNLLQALEEKRKYYRLRSGALLSLETDEFNRLTDFLNGLTVQPAEFEEGYKVPIGRGLGLIDGSDLFELQESFRQFLEQLRSPDELDIPIPNELDATLRSYQITGYKWMKTLAEKGFGGVLADDMGLGKTIQSIAFIISDLPAIRERKEPVLIVCPSSLIYNWHSELSKFAKSVQAIIMDGKPAERVRKQKESLQADVLITSYPILLQDEKWYRGQQFHTIFFDEAQVCKNPATRTARIAAKLKAAHRFGLTGTPIENALEELWSIFHIVFPELFGSVKDFSKLSRKQIARRVKPFLLRRTKADVLQELPAKTETIERAELLPEQKKLYGAYLAKLRHDEFKHLDKETFRKNRIRILSGITRLRQICCHPALFVDGYNGSSAKFEQLFEILEEAQQAGRRVLIFSQFTSMLSMISQELALRGMEFFYLDGTTPASERLELCRRFNEGERGFFLISLKAGGTGLNLTGADTVILYDTWWNPAVEAQATDRAHRMGQQKKVHVIKLIAKGTIEEKMNELQDRKRELIGEILDKEEEGTNQRLTDEDIEWLIGP